MRFALTLSIFLAQSAFAQEAGEIDLTVRRNGTKIGFEHISLRYDGADTDLAFAMEMQVRILGITVYRFKQTAQEIWHDGHLAGILSNTNDGKDHKLALTLQNDMLVGEGDDKPIAIPASIPPASLWNVSIIRSRKFFRNVDGSVIDVMVDDLGQDHYRLSGGLDEEVWFTPDGLLSKLRMKGSDGSDIVFAVE